MSRKQTSKRQTLENPLLYRNFIKEVHNIDPSFDEQIIDRQLTPEEAWRELHERHHLEAKAGRKESTVDEMRDVLYNMGIRHPRLQNFIIKEINSGDSEIGEGHLLQTAYELSQRPLTNVKRDIGRKAKPCKNLQQWLKASNKCDINAVDSRGARFVADWFAGD